MKCSKCGFEFQEGRNCPKCGENAILIHDDYFKRRKEWEEKNAKKPEEEAKKVFFTPELKKKLFVILTVTVVAILCICTIIYLVKEYVRTHKYDVFWNAQQDWIYTVNGAFAYDIPDAFSGVGLEADEKFCSEDGKVVAMTTYDALKSKYILYVSEEKQSYIAYESDYPIFIGQVGKDKKVLLLEMEYSEFGSVISSRALEISDTVKILSEDNVSFAETGRDGKYGIYDSKQLSIFNGGNKDNIAILQAEKIVITENGTYYLQQGILYDAAHEIVDDKVLNVFHIYGTDEILYCKSNEVVLVETSGRKINFYIENEFDYNSIQLWLRRGARLYGWSQSNLIELNCINHKMKLGNSERPYLRVK